MRRVIISAVAVGLMAASMTSLAGAGGAAVRFAQLDVVITRAVSQNGYPFVRWKLGAGWCSNVVEIASDPTVGDDGSFLDEHLVDDDVLDDAQTSWLSSSPSTANPGSYYAHIQVVSCDFSADAEWSAIVKFDFPASSPAPPPPAPKPAPPPPPNPNPTPPPTLSPKPTPNPASRMVLTLRNLPRGFRATKRRSYPTAASVAAGSRTTTAADYKKWGYVTGYEADFSREVGLSDVAKGAIRIGSTASIYQSTAGAHASMLRAKAICHRPPFHFLSIGRRVGNEALLCSHPETLRGKPARAYVVVWRRGRFRGAIIATGLEGGASARQAVSLARVQNSRLHS